MDLNGKRIIMAGVVSSEMKNPEQAFGEWKEQVKTSGGIIVGTVFQRRGVSRSNKPGGSKNKDLPLDAATYIGKGKVMELKEKCDETNAVLVLFLNPLKVSQIRKLEEITCRPVLCLPGCLT